MLKVFAFLTKREEIETEAFIEYYESNHVPLVLSLASTPTVYKRNYLVRGDEFNREDETVDFDVVTELVFPDRDALPPGSRSFRSRRSARMSRGFSTDRGRRPT